MKILVTGGLGYIGSHTCVELLENGCEVVVLDNLSNSKVEVKDKIFEITGKEIQFYQGDMLDKSIIENIFKENHIDAVIHFAGYKAVGESVKKPLMYYHNNIDSTLNLLEVMNEYDCKNLVFSSSATVYGLQETPRYVETMERKTPSSPYGKTKAMIEEILEDMYVSDNTWKITILRYFNPIGAHETGLIGEDPNGIPNNLMPYILKVAAHELECLTIFGDDYDTPDGTCIRDYIHVVDLAKGHIKALDKMITSPSNVYIYNLGSGNGVSVKEIVDTFETVNGIQLNYCYGKRREGDLEANFADASKALRELNWKTEKSLDDMCRDAWRFKNNRK